VDEAIPVLGRPNAVHGISFITRVSLRV
jgi:hypothetical protein